MSIGQIMPFIQAKALASSGSKTSSGTITLGGLTIDTKLAIIIGACVLVLVAALIIILCIKRSKKNTLQAVTVQQTETVSQVKPVPKTARIDDIKKYEAGSVCGGNSQNIGSRENQQDSFAVSDFGNEAICKANGIFAVVADGMGGLQNGAEISGIVVSEMLSYFENDKSEKTPAEKLNEMLMKANDSVNRYLSSQSGVQSGSTVVSVIIHNGGLNWVTVGDSRIYLLRKNRLWVLNKPHNLGAELDEKVLKGELSREEAQSNSERGALTSYIGIGELTLIDASIKPLPICAGDKILLCSDGVFGTISDDEIIEALMLPAEQAAEDIEKRVLQKGKRYQDNLTAVVLQYN